MHSIRYQTLINEMIKTKTLLTGLMVLLMLCATACARKKAVEEPMPPQPPTPVVRVDTSVRGLVIYYPPTDSIELRCFDRPDPKVDSSVVFCCAAAFTADWGTKPDHERICGDHVSRGRFYQRPRLKRNTGAFRAWESSWSFHYDEKAEPNSFRRLFKTTAIDGGSAFTQEMMIHKGNQVPTTRPFRNLNQFRALCQIDTTLCIIDSEKIISFGEFIQLLLSAGVDEALYMDMGPGWNYSWYREFADSNAVWIHSVSLSSATNWLVFCQE